MATNQNISNFIQTAASRDVARDNLFRVASINVQGLNMTEEDLLYCRGAKLPSRTIQNKTLEYMGMKINVPASSVAYTGSDAYDLEFYIDANGELREKFEECSRILFNENTSTGDWRVPPISDNITLVALDFHLNPIEYIKLHGASFREIGDYEAKISDGTGEMMKIKCKFAYHYYTRNGSDTVFANV